MKVLITDDSKIFREKVIKMISPFVPAESIEQTTNVSETIKYIRSNIPGIILLDIQMPDGSGPDVLNAMDHEKNRLMVSYSLVQSLGFEDSALARSVKNVTVYYNGKRIAIEDQKDIPAEFRGYLQCTR